MDKATELKAQAYDILAQIQFLQGRLAEVNAEISKLVTPAAEPAPVQTDGKADQE